MPLTPTGIARAALVLGDRDGPKAMSMRRIAAELGCDPMALYRHFAGREALLDAVADLALAAVADPGPDAEWDDRLRALGGGVRAAALAHPGIAAHLAGRPPLGEHGRRVAAGMAGALLAAGLPPVEAVRAVQALVAHLSAALAMAVAAGGRRDARWAAVAESLGAGGLPGDALFPTGSAEQFDHGLDLLLSGIRTRADAVT